MSQCQDKAYLESIKRLKIGKPHITKRAGLHVCTGRGISVESATASGAYVAWVRQAALAIICRTEAGQ